MRSEGIGAEYCGGVLVPLHAEREKPRTIKRKREVESKEESTMPWRLSLPQIVSRRPRMALILEMPSKSRQACGRRVKRALDADGAIVCHQACALGCEGIVSKRLGSPAASSVG